MNMLMTMVKPLRAGNIGANPEEWEIEPLDVPVAEPVHEPATPTSDPVHTPAAPSTPELEPVPA